MNLVDRPAAIDTSEQTTIGIVLQHGRKFVLERVEARGGGLRLVVSASTHLAPFEQSLDQFVRRDIQIDRGADHASVLREPMIQGLCLSERTREPVQDRPTLPIGLLKKLQDDLGNKAIGQ